MAERNLIPAEERRIVFKVKNSRFIATATPAFSVEEAKAFIARIKREFSDATHNVPAYQIGRGASVIAHCSDDGEPPGTAGHPVLAVLQGSGFGDVAVVVTRYFGGTKLGTGGLVRAYGDAAREVLAVLPLAEKVASHTLRINIPYNLYERAKSLVDEHGAQILDEAFAADVKLTLRLAAERFSLFQDALRDLSRGTLTAEIVAANEDAIIPLAPPPEDPSGQPG